MSESYALLAVGTLIGLFGYFIKRVMNQIDEIQIETKKLNRIEGKLEVFESLILKIPEMKKDIDSLAEKIRG